MNADDTDKPICVMSALAGASSESMFGRILAATYSGNFVSLSHFTFGDTSVSRFAFTMTFFATVPEME
jgi:hypothetical protein